MKVISIANNSTNIYLVPINDGWLMIDTGLPDTFSHLLQMLYQKGISIYEINYLFITHFHPDHAGLTQNLCDLGTNLIVHEEQVPYMHRLNIFYKKNPKANFRDIVANNAIVLSDANSRSFLNSIGIEGDLITTPGHSDDSISLIIDNCCAFTGDLPVYDPNETDHDLVAEDSWNIIQSHHVKTIYPSHNESYELLK